MYRIAKVSIQRYIAIRYRALSHTSPTHIIQPKLQRGVVDLRAAGNITAGELPRTAKSMVMLQTVVMSGSHYCGW